MDWRSPLFWMLCATVLILVSAGVRGATCSSGWRAWVCYQIAVVHRTFFARCQMANKCPFPESGPAIIVANHTSPVDPILIWHRHFAEFRKPRLRVVGFMMAKEFYERRGIVNWVCRAMQSIPMARSGQDMGPIRESLTRLKNGHLLGVFPEGRLNVASPDECLLSGGTGVAWLALKSQAPVIPVFIHHAPRGKSILGCYFVRTRVTLTYGNPIDLAAWYGRKLRHEELAEVTDLIMKSLADLGGISFTPIAQQCETPS